MKDLDQSDAQRMAGALGYVNDKNIKEAILDAIPHEMHYGQHEVVVHEPPDPEAVVGDWETRDGLFCGSWSTDEGVQIGIWILINAFSPGRHKTDQEPPVPTDTPKQQLAALYLRDLSVFPSDAESYRLTYAQYQDFCAYLMHAELNGLDGSGVVRAYAYVTFAFGAFPWCTYPD